MRRTIRLLLRTRAGAPFPGSSAPGAFADSGLAGDPLAGDEARFAPPLGFDRPPRRLDIDHETTCTLRSARGQPRETGDRGRLEGPRGPVRARSPAQRRWPDP